jgi:cytoskeletal protein CcmA (bactofilin family)
MGPVHALAMLELQPKARIQGDVHYTALEMHQGAIIAGQLRPIVGAEDKPTLKLAANNG